MTRILYNEWNDTVSSRNRTEQYTELFLIARYRHKGRLLVLKSSQKSYKHLLATASSVKHSNSRTDPTAGGRATGNRAHCVFYAPQSAATYGSCWTLTAQLGGQDETDPSSGVCDCPASAYTAT
jgi:hypothetical protein